MIGCLLIFCLLQSCFNLIYSNFGEVCSIGKNKKNQIEFKELLTSKVNFNWNPVNEFNKGKFLGKGSFGFVKLVNYAPLSGSNIAVAEKLLQPSSNAELNQILVELSALTAMGKINSPYTPILYGCHVEKTQKLADVYVIQELLTADLDSKEYMKWYQETSKIGKIGVMLKIFKGLLDLWKAGFTHNDVKPANMMYKKYFDEVVLIDFGLAQENTAIGECMGTPWTMSPNKFIGNKKLSHMDDAYSAVISILVMESEKGFTGIYEGMLGSLNTEYKNCFSTKQTNICYKKIAQNAVALLKKNGFGDPNNPKKAEDMNIPALFQKILTFEGVKLTFEDIIAILEKNYNTYNQGQVINKQQVKVDYVANLVNNMQNVDVNPNWEYKNNNYVYKGNYLDYDIQNAYKPYATERNNYNYVQRDKNWNYYRRILSKENQEKLNEKNNLDLQNTTPHALIKI